MDTGDATRLACKRTYRLWREYDCNKEKERLSRSVSVASQYTPGNRALLNVWNAPSTACSCACASIFLPNDLLNVHDVCKEGDTKLQLISDAYNISHPRIKYLNKIFPRFPSIVIETFFYGIYQYIFRNI